MTPDHHDWRTHSSSPHHHVDGDTEPTWDVPAARPSDEVTGLDVDDCESILLALGSLPTWFPGTAQKVEAIRDGLRGNP